MPAEDDLPEDEEDPVPPPFDDPDALPLSDAEELPALLVWIVELRAAPPAGTSLPCDEAAFSTDTGPATYGLAEACADCAA